MNKAAERRKEQRLDCFVPVDAKNGSKFSKTQTMDFSKNGIGFLSKVAIPLNERIAIEIELNDKGESVVVVGRVKWVRQLTGTEQYRYGLQFEKLPSPVRSRLSKFLKK